MEKREDEKENGKNRKRSNVGGWRIKMKEITRRRKQRQKSMDRGVQMKGKCWR